MAPGLARLHPDIKTYSGRGVTDPSATIHADLSPIGFHASVRSATGAWYIDPFYVGRTPSAYASYYGRDAKKTNRTFVEREVVPTKLRRSGRALPPVAPFSTGEQLRTYRLALITDPGYATYHGGPPNVTPAKVALMNRVNQPYEDDLTIRLQLVPNNDLLNFNTWAQGTAPNGPCGAAACFTQSQLTGCSSTSRARYVISQIIGASNYDIGHLALGQPGGGVANLGVVGRSNKAGGCTGVPTPIGDFFAIDYVAHEMGHQFSGNHTFNGNQLNCSGGNRNAAELGRARQRPVDHGLRRDLPDRRRAAAQRRVLLAAQPAGDHGVRLVESGSDQRGADRLAAPLRRRRRDPGGDLRNGLRADGEPSRRSASRSTRRRARPRAVGPRRSAARSRSRRRPLIRSRWART